MDIYDIPIAAITQQYLDYLHSMRALKLDIAGDYLVMAATLMTIKSRFLLPQPEPDEDEEDNEDDDPRDSLVAELLAYKVYQEAAGELRERTSAPSTFHAGSDVSAGRPECSQADCGNHLR